VHHLINGAGRCAISHTRYEGRYALRISIGNIHTERRHLDALWTELSTAETEAVKGGADALVHH
jgi:aromatic-L-amino-acid decarboxylase